MSILAEEEGTVGQTLVSIQLDHVIYAGVHTAVHIGNFVHSLVVDKTSVECLNGFLAGNEVLAATAFVTHTPEDNTGMITVAKYHTLLTVYVLTFPKRILGQAVVGMTLHIGFVHRIDAVIIV